MPERIRELQAIARDPIHAAMRNEDRPRSRQRNAADREADPRHGHTGGQVVGQHWLALVYRDRIAGTWHLERVYD